MQDRLLSVDLAKDTMTDALRWSGHFLVKPWEADGGLEAAMSLLRNDLRRKVVEARERGLNEGEVARLFGVSPSSIKRFSRSVRA